MSRLVISATSVTQLRTLAVWAGVTAGTGGVALLCVPVIATGPAAHSFARTLTWGCATVGLLAAVGAWLVTSDVARTVLTGRARANRAAGPVRAAVLLACGISLLGGPVAAQPPAPAPQDDPGNSSAQSDEHRPLAGLPLPDRPAVAPGRTASPTAPGTQVLVVRPGDHLWGIATGRLPHGTSEARIAAHVRALHTHNRDVVGPDPDLIRPGQSLRLPPTPGRDAR